MADSCLCLGLCCWSVVFFLRVLLVAVGSWFQCDVLLSFSAVDNKLVFFFFFDEKYGVDVNSRCSSLQFVQL